MDEKVSPSTSTTDEGKGERRKSQEFVKNPIFTETAATPTTSSKRLSPLDKLRETLLSFERSLDMLLVDLVKNDEDKGLEETEDDNQNKSVDKKEENTEEPGSGAGPSTSK